MSNERFDRLENMMEQLIKITANTNAAVSELKQEVKIIDQRMDTLDQRMDKLKSTMATKDDIAALEAKMEKGFSDVVNMINVIGDRTEGISRRIETKLDVLNERTFEHETDIRLLKKAK